MYPIIEVASDAFDLPEQLGTKRKFWYRDEAGNVFLFKEGRPNTGENWAEKVACEICKLLTIPHADYELAVWRNHKGVVSPKFLPDNARLVLGNEILGKMIKGYPHTQRYSARQHTVAIVMRVMRSTDVGMPTGYVSLTKQKHASDVFLGYLMLDALISNQDRHHENWGVIFSPGPNFSMSPSFDHASSLGRNEMDVVRIRRLNTRDQNDSVEAYVARAASAFYATPKASKPLSTLQAFEEGGRYAPSAVTYWLDRLESTDLVDYQRILAEVPNSEITEPARHFALKMLEINRQRLLASRKKI